MIISPTKARDMKERLYYLDQVYIGLRGNLPKYAKACGQISATLKDRIEKHDYSREDAFERKLQEVRNFLERGGKEPEPWG